MLRLKPGQHRTIRTALILEILSGLSGVLGIVSQVLLYQIPAGRLYRTLIILALGANVALAFVPSVSFGLCLLGAVYPGVVLCYVLQLRILATRTKWLDVIGRLRKLEKWCVVLWILGVSWSAAFFLRAPLLWIVLGALPILAMFFYIGIQQWEAMAEMIRTARLRERVSAGGSRKLRRPPPPRTRTEAS